MSLIKSVVNYFVFPTWNLSPTVYEQTPFYPFTKFKNNIPYLLFKYPKPRAIIIYYHGNLETIYDIAPFLQLLSNLLESTVISYEYPDYSIYHSVKPSEKTVFDDALTMYDHVLANYADNQDKNIVLLGRSLGSSPAVYTASLKPEIRSLILISPFTSIFGTIIKSRFSFDMFLNYQYMACVNSPTLLIHGNKDKVVPVRNSETLFKIVKNKESKLVLFNSGTHNNLLNPKNTIFEKIIDEILFFI